MNENIKNYIDFLFRDAPETKEVNEIKDEMISDIYAKYENFIKEGMDDQTAFSKSISNIGDVNILIEEISGEKSENSDFQNIQDIKMTYQCEKIKRYFPYLKAFAIFLLILSVVPVMINDKSLISEVIMLIMIATGVMILVFISHYNLEKEKKIKKDDRSKLQKNVSSLIYLSGICIYLLVSFLSERWDISWIIFVFTYTVDKLSDTLFDLKRQKI